MMKTAAVKLRSRPVFGRVTIAATVAVSAAFGLGLFVFERQTKPWRLAAENATADGIRVVELIVERPDAAVAEIGAGQGRMTVAVAQRLGGLSHVFSTELSTARLQDIRKAVLAAQLRNVTIVRGTERDTNLPRECCDAIFMSLVYHHFSDAAAMNASLFRSLRPGGHLLVIDYSPRSRLLTLSRLRDGANHHIDGVSRQVLTKDLTQAGFKVERVFDRWSRWPDRRYGIIFQKPANILE